MKSATFIPTTLLLLLAIFPVTVGHASSVIDSPHDLSTFSEASIKSSTEERICIFCHTPHHATLISDPDYSGPLWSREENLNVYTIYDSTTVISRSGQPQGPSRLCLSCHDGTIALSSPASLASGAAMGDLDSYSSAGVLGQDLSNDHPISMEYAVDPREFRDPSLLKLDRIKLYYRNGAMNVECTSCHDPHDNQYENFLVVDSRVQRDALCTTCHNKNGWNDSAHQSESGFPAEVAKNGCVNCHVPHNAEQGASLLRLSDSSPDSNCIANCHNDPSIYSSDIPSQFARNYSHSINYGDDLHLPTEILPLTAAKKHVLCVDCHNPHQARLQDAPLSTDPVVNRTLQGARGVARNGEMVIPALYEYQVCFGCHSGNAAKDGNFDDPLTLNMQRVFQSYDQSERFDPISGSFHPVVTQASGSLASLQTTAKTDYISCSSCHQPHGSLEPYLLRAANPDVFPNDKGTDFPLCFISCHSETYLLSIAPSATLHRNHVVGPYASGTNDKRVPCASCHDPHGVANSQNLINFDRRYVPADAVYTAPSCAIAGAGTSGLVCHPASVPYPATY